jgi:flagellar hook protein FlgE
MGLSKFDDIDFWNLAGRAGRLTKELAGNVICVRAEKRKNRWETDSDLDLLRNTKIEQKKYPIDKSRKSIFDNMEHSLKNEAYSKKNPTATEINMWNHFANIALIHEKIGEESVLKSNFIEKNPNAKKLLNKVNQEIKVPFDVLISSSSIKPVYQNKILKIQNLEPLPDYVDYATAKKFLLKLSDYYN